MVPCELEALEQKRERAPPCRPLMAAVMFERLQRMSTEHGLNLSPEDILISAYLGHNLVYKPQATGGDAQEEREHPEGAEKTSTMAPGSL